MNKSLLLLLTLLISTTGVIFSQELKTELEDVYASYKSLEKLTAGVEVRVFRQKSDDTPISNQVFQIRKSGSNFFYSIEGSDFLFNERCAVMINKQGKYIYYAPHNERPDLNKLMIEPKLDSILASCDSIQFHGLTEFGNRYTLFRYDQSIVEADIYIDPQRSVINRLTYYYNEEVAEENNKVEIEYTDWNTAPLFNDGAFSEYQYIAKSNKKIVPSASYAGYEIIVSN